MRIFLSYSTQDHARADALRGALLARRPALDIYFAPRRNEIGAYWIARLDTELRAADAVLLLLGRRVGPWQELEYYDALRRNRCDGRPLIAPVVLGEAAPGLPFLDQFHHLCAAPDDLGGLAERVLASLDGTGLADAPPPWRLLNPYRGLQAMETQDAAFFFGREALTGAVLERFVAEPGRLPVLIGNSGVGKSSVAMAGVLAALKSRLWPGDAARDWPAPLAASHCWPIVRLKPGVQPVTALARSFAALWLDSPAEIEEEALKWQRLLRGDSSLAALVDASLARLAANADAEPPARVVLHIDQGEELWSPRVDRDEARRFTELVAAALGEPALLALMSLRSDYYGRLQEDDALFRAVSLVDVTPLAQDALERVIRLPAERLGVRFEHPEVVALIAAAAAREPGALPMLSDLLADTWKAMAAAPEADGVLRFPLGLVDISRPLADKAERFVAAHPGATDALRRLVTLKLALVPKEGEIVRRRAHRSECSEAEWALVEAMAAPDWRLVTTGEEGGEPCVEVAHEALLRHWPRAMGWLDASREFLIWRHQFEAEYRAWAAADAGLRARTRLNGLRLELAERWRRERADDLSEGERRFIDDSAQAVAEAEAREQAATRRLARQRRWIQRVVAFALVAVSVVAVVAVQQARRAVDAEDAALAARDRALAAEADALAARDRALREEEAARRQADLALARRLALAAERTLDEGVGETTLAGLLATESLRRASTVDGQRILRRVLALTPARSQPLASPWPHARVAFDADGRVTVFSRTRQSVFDDGPVHGVVAVVDAKAWQIAREHAQHGAVWPVYSPDGRWKAVAGFGRRVQVFDVAAQALRLDAYQDDMVAARFAPDGGALYVVRTDGRIEVRSAPQWHVTRTLGYPLAGERVLRVEAELSPDGALLAVLAGGRGSWLVPTDGGDVIALQDDDIAQERRVTVERSFERVFGASPTTPPDVHRPPIAQSDDVPPPGVLRVRESGERASGVVRAVFSPAGAHLVTVGRRNDVHIRDAHNGRTLHGFRQAGSVRALAVSPDGAVVASATRQGDVWLTELASGRRTHMLSHRNHVNALVFSPDGALLATASDDRTAAVWAVASGARTAELAHDDEVWSVAFGDGGATLVTGSRDGTLRAFDLVDGVERDRLRFAGGVQAIAPRPGADELAVSVRLSRDEQGWSDVAIVHRDGHEARFEHNGPFRHILPSPDGRRLATVTSGTRELKLWDSASGALLATRDLQAVGAAFSADGARLVLRREDRRVTIADGHDGRPLADIGEPGGVTAVRLLRDARTLVSFGQDGSFHGRDALGGDLLWSSEPTRSARYSVVLSADGTRYAGLADDGKTLEVGDTRRGRVILSLPIQSGNHRLSADGRRLLVIERVSAQSSAQSSMSLWDVDNGERLLHRSLAHGLVRTLWLPGDRFVMTAVRTSADEPDGFVALIDAAHGDTLWSEVFGDTQLIDVLSAGPHAEAFAVSAGQRCQIRDSADGALIIAVAVPCRGAAVIFPDGERVALAGRAGVYADDDYIDVRDLASGASRALIRVPALIRDLAVGRDGRTLIAGVQSDAGHGLRVWRTDDWSQVQAIDMPRAPREVFALADPDRVAVFDFDARLAIWRLSAGMRERVFAHGANADDFALAAAADRVATSLGGTIRLWDAGSAVELAHHEGDVRVSELAISPDGARVAFLTERVSGQAGGERLGTLQVWTQGSGEPPRVLPLEGPRGLHFDRDGQRLVVQPGDGTVRVLDAASLRTLSSIAALPGVRSVRTAFDAAGGRLFVAEERAPKAALRVFATAPLRELARLDVAQAHPAPGTRSVATLDERGRWRLLDLDSVGADEPLLAADPQPGDGASRWVRFDPRSRRFLVLAEPAALAAAPDFLRARITLVPRAGGEFLNAWTSDASGARVAVVGEDGIAVHATDDGRRLAAWPGVTLAGAGLFVGHALRPVRGSALIGDGDGMVARDTDDYDTPQMRSRLWLWRWSEGEPKLLSDEGVINMVAASADGALIATAEGFAREDRSTGRTVSVGVPQVRIWDALSGALLRTIATAAVADAVAFSPDAARLAVRTASEVLLFATEDGRELTRLALAGDRFAFGGGVAFALDGRRLVAESTAGVHSWALDGGEDRLLRHEHGQSGFEVSPDGGLLVTRTRGVVRVWELEHGTRLFELALDERDRRQFTLVGPGNELVAIGDQHIERVRWQRDELIAEACRRLGRDFEAVEWQRFFDDEVQRPTCPAATTR